MSWAAAEVDADFVLVPACGVLELGDEFEHAVLVSATARLQNSMPVQLTQPLRKFVGW